MKAEELSDKITEIEKKENVYPKKEIIHKKNYIRNHLKMKLKILINKKQKLKKNINNIMFAIMQVIVNI